MRRHNLIAAGLVLILSGVVAAALRRRSRRRLQRRPMGSIGRCCRLPSPNLPTYTELDARNANRQHGSRSRRRRARPERRDRVDRRRRLRRSSTFGGPIHADAGRAGTSACASTTSTPRRCAAHANALKTGRNHHTVNTGSIDGDRDGVPGNTGRTPNSVAPLADMLRLTATAPAPSASGTRRPPGKLSVSGPFDRWPRIRASTSSTASSAARPTSGIRSSTTARSRSSRPRWSTTTSPWT